jgi:hypothetical protein
MRLLAHLIWSCRGYDLSQREHFSACVASGGQGTCCERWTFHRKPAIPNRTPRGLARAPRITGNFDVAAGGYSLEALTGAPEISHQRFSSRHFRAIKALTNSSDQLSGTRPRLKPNQAHAFPGTTQVKLAFPLICVRFHLCRQRGLAAAWQSRRIPASAFSAFPLSDL